MQEARAIRTNLGLDKVSNGTRLLAGRVDLPSAAAQRYRHLIATFTAEIGGNQRPLHQNRCAVKGSPFKTFAAAEQACESIAADFSACARPARIHKSPGAADGKQLPHQNRDAQYGQPDQRRRGGQRIVPLTAMLPGSDTNHSLRQPSGSPQPYG
jgi:hypothetical protein